MISSTHPASHFVSASTGGKLSSKSCVATKSIKFYNVLGISLLTDALDQILTIVVARKYLSVI